MSGSAYRVRTYDWHNWTKLSMIHKRTIVHILILPFPPANILLCSILKCIPYYFFINNLSWWYMCMVSSHMHCWLIFTLWCSVPFGSLVALCCIHNNNVIISKNLQLPYTLLLSVGIIKFVMLVISMTEQTKSACWQHASAGNDKIGEKYQFNTSGIATW